MKTYRRTCAPSEDSDQPVHSCSLIRIFSGRVFFLTAKDAKFQHVDNEDSNLEFLGHSIFTI